MSEGPIKKTQDPDTDGIIWCTEDVGDNFQSTIERVHRLHEEKRSDALDGFYRFLIDKKLQDIDKLLSFAKLAKHFHYFDQAADLYIQVVALDVSNPCYRDLAKVFMMTKSYEAAEACFKVAIASKPKDAEFYHLYGLLWLQKNDHQQAVKYFLFARSIDAAYLPVILSFARLRIEQGLFDMALELLESGFAHHPNSNTLKALKGCVFAATEQTEGAQTVFDKRLVYEAVPDLAALNMSTLDMNAHLSAWLQQLSEAGGLDDLLSVDAPGSKLLHFIIEQGLQHCMQDWPKDCVSSDAWSANKDFSIEAQGHLLKRGEALPSHVVENAWLCGYYFIRMPANWLEESHKEKLVLCEPPPEIKGYVPDISSRVAVENGKLLFFPAWFWQSMEGHNLSGQMHVITFSIAIESR